MLTESEIGLVNIRSLSKVPLIDSDMARVLIRASAVDIVEDIKYEWDSDCDFILDRSTEEMYVRVWDNSFHLVSNFKIVDVIPRD